MDWWQNGIDYGNKNISTNSEINIWPIEHPIEPQDEDQPIKCPNPHPSLLNVSNEEEQVLDCPRIRTEKTSSMLNKEEMAATSESRARPMRKRHHRSSTRKDNTSTPTPPRHSFSARDNLRMFPMFQKFYKNES